MTKNEEGIIRQNVKLARNQMDQLMIEAELHGISVTEICYICRDVPVRSKNTTKYIKRLADYYEEHGTPRPTRVSSKKVKQVEDTENEDIVRERIAQIIYSTGLKYKDIAYEVGVSKQIITEIMSENGRPPSLATAVKFAYYFKISLDYICGLDEPMTVKRNNLPPIELTSLNEAVRGHINEIVGQSNLTGREIAKMCGIDEHTICNIQKAKHTPPALSTVIRFAKGMKVSMEWLCGLEE